MIARNCCTVELTALVCMILTLVAMTAAPAQEDPRLLIRASDDGHTLVDGAGEPFFWLGDTAWSLLTSLWPEEAEVYLEDRRQKGFNVVQCILVHWDGEPAANYNGERPWLDGDPSTPNSAYFDHVEVVRQIAAEKGMILALLPSWGWYVTEAQVINKENAFLYGNWLGVRFADATNVVWVLGGDRPAAGYEDVFRLLADGIVAGDDGAHLMTYHPRGGGQTSAEWFADDDWINMHMIQTSHNIDNPDYRYVLADYARTPPKPSLVGEPRYENIIHGLRREGPRIDDHDVRKAAWHAALSGAAGHTYGANGIFQFPREGEPAAYDPGLGWEEALALPGAAQMGVMKRFMVENRWWRLAPGPSLVSENSTDGYYVAAARSRSGDFACLYFPERIRVGVDMGAIRGEGVKASWFNPRTGASEEIGEFDNTGRRHFICPTSDEDPDYVLVLRSARPDLTRPELVAVIAGGDPNRLTLRFSESLDPTSATLAANYVVTPGVTVNAAELRGGGKVVALATSELAEGAQYTVAVTGVGDVWDPPNLVAADTSLDFAWTVTPPRVIDGLVALYNIADAADGVAPDASGVEEPMDLVADDASLLAPVPGGLELTGASLIASDEPATALVTACMETNEITVEAWVRAGNLEQTGPARVVTCSVDSADRNFTLGQSGDRWDMRLRTTVTSSNGTPSLSTEAGTVTTDLAHLVYTRDTEGQTRFYINGEEVARGEVAGDFSNWGDWRLALGNELTRDRTWLGEIHLVAVYSRALSAEEVARNFAIPPVE